jgi:hypothetical protein
MFLPSSMLAKMGFEVVTRLLNPRTRGLEFTRSIFSGVIWELPMLRTMFYLVLQTHSLKQ